jgi:hypothetical protein
MVCRFPPLQRVGIASVAAVFGVGWLVLGLSLRSNLRLSLRLRFWAQELLSAELVGVPPPLSEEMAFLRILQRIVAVAKFVYDQDVLSDFPASSSSPR